MDNVALDCASHPVRDYLNRLEWDGVPRLGTWLTTYTGAQDTALTRKFGELTLKAAVARVTNPGVKFDSILVLEGTQRAGKSSTVRALAGNDWFDDSVKLGDDSKIMQEKTRGKWIFEISELGGLRKSGVEDVKAQISKQSDRARPAYGRRATELPRQFIMIGTTNDDKYLLDPTGNTRYWPVKTGVFDVPALRRDRDQLWAEAVVRYGADPSLILPEALRGDATAAQSSRLQQDPIVDALEDLLRDFDNHRVATDDLWAAIGARDVVKRGATQGKSIANAMRKLGWTDSRMTRGNRRRGYAIGEGDCTLRFYEGTRDLIPA